MQPIPQRVKDIIRARRQIGPDKPTAEVDIVDMVRGGVLRAIQHTRGPAGMGFHFDKRQLYVTDNAGGCFVFDMATGNVVEQWQLIRWANGAEIDGDDNNIFWVTASGGNIDKYDLNTKQRIATFSRSGANGIAAPPGPFLYVGIQSGRRVDVVRKDNGQVVKSWPGIEASGVAWDGRHVWVSGYDTHIVAYDPDTGEEVSRFEAPSNQMTSLTFDGVYLWSGNNRTNELIQFAKSVDFSEGASLRVPVKSIRISRTHNVPAAGCEIEINNPNGEYSPDGGLYPNFILPNKLLRVKQGYGDNIIQTYYGQIDDIEVRAYPYAINIGARDLLKRALDQIITNPANGSHTVTFLRQRVDYMFIDLAKRIGWSDEQLNVDICRIVIEEKTFSWQTYGDAFAWLAEVAGFEFYADEYGNLNFIFPTDRQPEGNDTINLIAANEAELKERPIVYGSVNVNKGQYKEGQDYIIDYANGTIKRAANSSIPSGANVTVRYVFPAWVFIEGESIQTVGVKIDDADQYRQIKAYGRSENGKPITALYEHPNPDLLQLPEGKVLKVELYDPVTKSQLQEIVNNMGRQMLNKMRRVDFSSVGIPYLQTGDCIQVIESSSGTGDIYRIQSINSTHNAQGYKMDFVTYLYGYAPLPVEDDEPDEDG